MNVFLDVLDVVKWIAYVSCTVSVLFVLYIAWHCCWNEFLDARWRRRNRVTRQWGDSRIDHREWL